MEVAVRLAGYCFDIEWLCCLKASMELGLSWQECLNLCENLDAARGLN